MVPGINYGNVKISDGSSQTEITSIKIKNLEICKTFNYFPAPKRKELQEPTNNRNWFSTRPKYDPNKNVKFFNDCKQRNSFTENSVQYCPNYRPEFVIEQRYTFNDESYWCIIINNANFKLSSQNHLHIAYSSISRLFHWEPEDAYTQPEEPASEFHLGNRRTVIAVSGLNGEFPKINSITIDNESICDYFNPTGFDENPATIPIVSTFDYNSPSNPPELEQPIVFDVTDESAEQNRISTAPNSKYSCGEKPTNINPLQTIDVTSSRPSIWPWHAAIYKLKSTVNRFFICGGTLISRKIIVTVAHCVVETNLIVVPDRFIVDLGRIDLTIESTAKEYRVSDVVVHEAYNPEIFENDIALITLTDFVQVSRFINFICLPQVNTTLANQVGTNVGWSRDNNFNIIPKLSETELLVYGTIECLDSNREFVGQYLTSTNFCAGIVNQTTACRKDSGSGLVFKSGNHWYLGGISSLGVSSKEVVTDCDLTIYTDVTKFIPWIIKSSKH